MHTHTYTSHKINKCKDQSPGSHLGDSPEWAVLCTVCTHQHSTPAMLSHTQQAPKLFCVTSSVCCALASKKKPSRPVPILPVIHTPHSHRLSSTIFSWVKTVTFSSIHSRAGPKQRQRGLATLLCGSLPSAEVSYPITDSVMSPRT